MNSLDFPILSLILAVPTVAAIACLFLSASGARWTALIATLIDFVLGIILWMNYDIGGAQWQFWWLCGICVGVSVAMLAFFRRKNWI